MEKGAVLPRLQQVLGRKQVRGECGSSVFSLWPGGRLAGRAPLPCQTGTRGTLSSSADPALAQMVYYPLAGTLCLAPPCSAVPLPPPSDPLGSGPGSHLHPPTLPLPSWQPRQAAGWESMGLGGGLASLCLFCFGQARLGGQGHLPFHASIRLVNPCPVSHKCFCLWLRLLSAFHFLWFACVKAVRAIKKTHKQSGGQKPQEGANSSP